MADPPLVRLKARYVFPGVRPPIPEGVVTIRGPEIVSVGRSSPSPPAVDLGNVALLPGLINAHVHLEFSDLAEPIGRPGMRFPEWVQQVVEHRRRSEGTTAERVAAGLEACRRCGTTTIAEIAQPEVGLAAYVSSGVRGAVLAELIAPTPDRALTARKVARRYLRAQPRSASWQPGLSPHAPYSVHPGLLAAAVELCGAADRPVAMHLAESREEMEFLETGGGPIVELLESLGAWDPGAAAQAARPPLEYLKMLSRAPHALVIHGNYLADEEFQFLASRPCGTAVVYCPRSHAYFGHDPYPLARMKSAGVRVALGTDSRASAPDLSILAEMRHVARTHPNLSPSAVLHMGTLDGASALGQANRIGALKAGYRADLTAVALPDGPGEAPYELLFGSDGPVVGRWFAGEPDPAIRPSSSASTSSHRTSQ